MASVIKQLLPTQIEGDFHVLKIQGVPVVSSVTSTARGYFDYTGPALTTAFPAVYVAGNTAYPPIGGHSASKLYINTTEKVVFISNQTNPAFAANGPGVIDGTGANALTAFITANVGYTGILIPGTGTQNPPSNVKFTGSAPSAGQDDPVRMVVFKVANTRSTISGGMPVSGTIATQNGRFGGVTMTDSSWSWFKYSQFNLSNTAGTLIWSDILTSWNRWWISSDGQDNYPQFISIQDAGDVSKTVPVLNDTLKYNGTLWAPVSNLLGYTNEIFFSSAIDLVAGNFIGQYGQSATEAQNIFLMVKTGSLVRLDVRLSTAPGGANTRTFTVRINGVATAMVVTITGAAVTGSITTTIAYVSGGQISIQHTQAGAAASSGSLTLQTI